MKRMLFPILGGLLLVGVVVAAFAFKKKSSDNEIIEPAHVHSIYEYKVPALDGGTIDFSTFKGKKILIVNTASECGYTPQYETLEALYKKYQSTLVIVGFPANNFGGQEPGSNAEIASFCKKNYGVTFPMAAKVSVKGDDQAPIYHFLQNKSENGWQDNKVGWNFNKFLFDETGKPVGYFGSNSKPLGGELEKAIAGK